MTTKYYVGSNAPMRSLSRPHDHIVCRDAIELSDGAIATCSNNRDLKLWWTANSNYGDNNDENTKDDNKGECFFVFKHVCPIKCLVELKTTEVQAEEDFGLVDHQPFHYYMLHRHHRTRRRRIAFGDYNGGIHILTTTTASTTTTTSSTTSTTPTTTTLFTFPESHQSQTAGVFCSVTSMVLMHDGKHLASTSYDTTAKIWRVEDGICVATLRGHLNCVMTICELLSVKRGGVLVTGSVDATLILWKRKGMTKWRKNKNIADVESVHAKDEEEEEEEDNEEEDEKKEEEGDEGDEGKGYEFHSILRGHKRSVFCVIELHNDDGKGGLIASGSLDGTVCLWDAKTSTRLSTLCGHADSVNSLVVMAGGRGVGCDLLLSGSSDYTMRVWNYKTGECLATMQMSDTIQKAALLIDGSLLVLLSHSVLVLKTWIG